MPEALEPATETETASRKRFSLDEANRALTYVRRVVEDITTQYARIVELRRAMEGDEEGHPVEHVEAEYETAMDRLGGLVDELHEAGVELRDFERGIVAFPADHDDRVVLFSWQPGEPAVTHFNEQEESITQRRPVSELDLAA